MADHSDPLNQDVRAMLLVHRRSQWNEAGMLGIKLLAKGKMYGVLISQRTLRDIGLVIDDTDTEVKTLSFDFDELVEGVAPSKI